MISRCVLLTLCAVSAYAQTVQVGVFTLFHPKRLEIRPVGSTALLVTGDHMRFILNSEPGRTSATVELAKGRMFLDSDPVEAIKVAARDGGPTDFILGIPGKIERRYHGVLTISADP